MPIVTGWFLAMAYGSRSTCTTVASGRNGLCVAGKTSGNRYVPQTTTTSAWATIAALSVPNMCPVSPA
jgi:hypothetical protein